MENNSKIKEKIKKLLFIRKKFWQPGLFLLLLFFVLGSGVCFAFDVGYYIAYAFYSLMQVAGYLLGWAMNFLNTMVSANFYNTVMFSSEAMGAVNLGWSVVRDFLNLFFILMLLLIAIGTILQVPSYGDKRMVFSVVLAALLVNFSKPISLFFIDASQIFMNFFIDAVKLKGTNTYSDLLLNKIGFQEIFNGELKNNNDKSWTGEIIFCFVGIIFLLIMAMMILLLAVNLLLRVVAYWILIILSPLAFFGLAMPRTFLGTIQKDWTKKMTEWSIFGPVQMFFIWLSLAFFSKIGEVDLLSINTDALKIEQNYSKIILNASKILVTYTAVIYFLYYGFSVSKKVAATGAANVMSWGEKKVQEFGKKHKKKLIWGAAGVAALGSSPLLAAGAGAAYLGGRSAARWARDYGDGARQKMADKPVIGGFFRTKKEKEEKQAEKRAERVARVKGPDELKKYQREKANKQKKEWDDLGVEDSFLFEKMENGTEIEKKAAASLLGEKNKIKTGEDFKKALSALAGDKVLEGNLRKKLKDENVFAFMSHDIANAQDSIKRTEDDQLFELLKDNTFLKDLLEKEGIDVKEKNAVNQKLREYKTNEDSFKQAAYNKQLNELSPEQLAKQSMNLYEKESVVLKNYFKEHLQFYKGDKQGSKSREELEKQLDRQSNGNRSNLVKKIIQEAQKESGRFEPKSDSSDGNKKGKKLFPEDDEYRDLLNNTPTA